MRRLERMEELLIDAGFRGHLEDGFPGDLEELIRQRDDLLELASTLLEQYERAEPMAPEVASELRAWAQQVIANASGKKARP